ALTFSVIVGCPLIPLPDCGSLTGCVIPSPDVARTRTWNSPGTAGANRYFHTVHTYGELLLISLASCQFLPSSVDTSTRLIPLGPASAHPTISIGALTGTARAKMSKNEPGRRGLKNPELTLRQALLLHPRASQ